jgi:hypothetical protein
LLFFFCFSFLVQCLVLSFESDRRVEFISSHYFFACSVSSDSQDAFGTGLGKF